MKVATVARDAFIRGKKKSTCLIIMIHDDIVVGCGGFEAIFKRWKPWSFLGQLAADGRPAACIRAVEDHRRDVVNWAQENSSGVSGMCRISSCYALSKRTLHQLTINIHLLCGKTAVKHGERWEFDSPGSVDRSHSEHTTLSDLCDAQWSQCWPIPNWNLQMFVSCSPVMAPFFSTLPTVVKSSPVSPREHRPSAISGTGAILSSGTILNSGRALEYNEHIIYINKLWDPARITHNHSVNNVFPH